MTEQPVLDENKLNEFIGKFVADVGAAMHASIAAGGPVEVTEVPSLADSLGGGIGTGNRLSFPLCRDLLDDVVLVSEAEIYAALQAIYFRDRLVCEGGSAVAVAALLSGRLRCEGVTATILTGRNIDMELHASIMRGDDIRLGDVTITGTPYSP